MTSEIQINCVNYINVEGEKLLLYYIERAPK